MVNLIRTVFIFLCVNFLLFSCSLGMYAFDVAGTTVVDEIEIPSDLNFKINNSRSKYNYFMQATARKDGCFAVYSRQIAASEYVGGVGEAYIDIYDCDGTFIQELCFTTPFEVTIELTEETVNIYFYSNVLVYNLETQRLINYSIPEGFIQNSIIYENSRKKEFVSGEWTYFCESKGWLGEYVKLSRSNNNITQVLVDLPGDDFVFWKSIIIAAGICLSTVVIRECLRKHLRAKRNNQSADSSICSDEKQKTEDGSLSSDES